MIPFNKTVVQAITTHNSANTRLKKSTFNETLPRPTKGNSITVHILVLCNTGQ